MTIDHQQEHTILKRYIEKMPTFSPATSKIIKLANNMNTLPNEIVAAIRLDPVLTGRVLQLVNSAYFSLAQKVTSLNRAVVYLGINTIKNLALSTAVMVAFDNKDKALADLVLPTWRHSLATAVCCRSIAKAAKIPQNSLEEYFVIGLLHDIGSIILMQAFFESLPHNGLLKSSQEKDRYGKDHSEVGAETLTRWKFSEDLIAAVATHHHPDPKNKMSFFIHVADAMTYRLHLNAEQDTRTEADFPINPEAWSVLGLTEEKVLAELATAAEQIQKAEVFLNISSSKEKVVEKE